jgi:hypothetical protein
MGQRSEELAKQYEGLLAEIEKAVNDCPDAKWGAVCGDEGWTVAATAHHVGAQLPLEKEYLIAAAEGSAMPSYTWDEIHARNARHAQEFTASTRDEALRVIRDNGYPMADWVRGLSDEQLDRTSKFPLADGAEVSTQQLIQGGVLIDHARAHLQSIQSV